MAESLMPSNQTKLIAMLREGTPQRAVDVAKAIAYCADVSIVPALFVELENAKEIRGLLIETIGMDSREEWRQFAIESAIVSLLSPEEAEKELEAGRLSMTSLVRRRNAASSLDEFWNPHFF
jgi:hypothetical protein